VKWRLVVVAENRKDDGECRPMPVSFASSAIDFLNTKEENFS
jgi:hypothetical protein